MKALSIRVQVALLAVALTVLSVFSVAFTVIHSERAILVRGSHERIEDIVQGINRIAAESLVEKDPLMLPSYLIFLQKEHPELAYFEFSINGRMHKSGPEVPGLTFISRTLAPNAVAIRLGFKTLALQEEIDKPLNEMVNKTLKISGLLLIFCVIAVIYLSEVLTRPLGALTKGAQAVGAGEFDVSVPVAGSRETRALATHFNEMTTNLKDFMDLRDYILQSLSHDINAPLGGLKAYLELMEEGRFPSGDEGRRSVMTLLAAVARMQELLSNTLTFFRMQKNGKGESRKQAVAFSDVSREIMGLFSPMSSIKKITLQDATTEQGLAISTDPDLLRQTMSNLVSNALKYTDNGGAVRFGAQARGEDIVLWVADTGRGISAEDLPHIFEKFRRGNNRDGVPGTGLGLSIVHDAVVKIGGDIRAESWPGKGSRFVVVLPKAKADAVIPERETVL